MKKSPLTLLIVSIALFLVAVGSWTFSFLWLRSANQKISVLNQSIIDSEKKLEEQTNLERTIETTEKDRQELEKYFLSSNNVVSFLEEVESYGEISNTKLEIQNVEYDNEGATLKFKIKGQGYYRDVYHLLLVLENAPYEFHFNEILFNLGSKESQAFKTVTTNKLLNPILNNAISDISRTNDLIVKENESGSTVVSSGNVWDGEFSITLKSFIK